jgi:hypothetical protein
MVAVCCNKRFLSCLIVFLVLVGCRPEGARQFPINATAMPEDPLIQLQQAYGVPDPDQRKIAVVDSVHAYLRSKSAQTLDDRTLSLKITEAAFSSGTLIFADSGFVSRNGGLAVVSIPNGVGLYLYDLRSSRTIPIELSAWTIGIDSIQPYWHVDEVGVIYNTSAADGSFQGHYVLAKLTNVGWRVAWFSDETPDWWFNSQNAAIAVNADLSRIQVVGQSLGTTAVFDEVGNSPRRSFSVEWVRDHDRYKLDSPPAEFDRTTWLWGVSQPSAYATLVEFIERVRLQDHEGAAKLVGSQEVVDAAFAYGLYLGDSTFHVTAFNQDRITFQGRQGAFVVEFLQPVSPNEPWLITGLIPLGAAPTSGPPVP